MALNSGATIIPGRGTAFYGAEDVTPPSLTQLATLSPTSSITGWTSFGHTSRDNNVSFSKDGGDTTQVGSWWDDALDSTVDPTTLSLTINSIQTDSDTLSMAFPGGAIDGTAGTYGVGAIGTVRKALFILMVGGTKRLGMYLPSVNLGLGDAPSIDATAFFEIQLNAAILGSPTKTAGGSALRLQFVAPWLVSP